MIVVSETGRKIPTKELEDHWFHNSDGAGFMFPDGRGKLVIFKPFFTVKSLLLAYDRIPSGRPHVVHFRLSTSGKEDKKNTHPHRIDNHEIGLVHNGVLHDFLPGWERKKVMSDTVWLVRTVLARRASKQLMHPHFLTWLGKVIGYNKIVLMDGQGRIGYANKHLGVEKNGFWYSSDPDWKPVYTHLTDDEKWRQYWEEKNGKWYYKGLAVD
jgi:predicted glutamine amidotransferase